MLNKARNARRQRIQSHRGKRLFAVRALMLPLMTAGVLTGTGPAGASAATCVSWTGAQPPSPASGASLSGAAVVSSCGAWAVGYYNMGGPFQTLIEHWNGSSWVQQSSPDPGGTANLNQLLGAAATSSGNAWAVGQYNNGTTNQTLIEHWNGSNWMQEPSANPGSNGNVLNAVAATSSGNAWAVGDYDNGTTSQTLTEHWTGTTWKRVASPNPGGSTHGSYLYGVAASSASNAWAVGYYSNGTGYQTLTAHWNGTTWKRVASPSPGGSVRGSYLYGVAVISASNAWAVGQYYNGITNQSLIEHWNGSKWKVVSSPSPGTADNFLDGVATFSASNIWAVGDYSNGTVYQPVIAHWNGTGWAKVSSPNPGGDNGNSLFAVAGTSASNMWAVGNYSNGTLAQALALHCC